MFNGNSAINYPFINLCDICTLSDLLVWHWPVNLLLHYVERLTALLNIDSNQHTWLFIRKSMNRVARSKAQTMCVSSVIWTFAKTFVFNMFNEPCSRLLSLLMFLQFGFFSRFSFFLSFPLCSTTLLLWISTPSHQTIDINHFKSNYLRSCEKQVKFLVAATKLCEFLAH